MGATQRSILRVRKKVLRRWEAPLFYYLGRCLSLVDIYVFRRLIRSKRVAQMAAVAGMPTTVHISGGFGFVYMLHFASCTPDIGQYQEYKRNIERYSDWFDPPLRISDGSLIVPEGLGVGIKNVSDVLQGAIPVG